MPTVSDPQDEVDQDDLSELLATSPRYFSPVLPENEQIGVEGTPGVQHGARCAGRSVHEDLDTLSDAHQGSNQQPAALSSWAVGSAYQSDIASVIMECGDSAVRSLLVEPDELGSSSQAALDTIRDVCSKVGGAIHAVSRKDGGMLLVTYADSRYCKRAKVGLSRALGTVASVQNTRPDEPEHDITGLVLAVKQVDKEGDEIVVDGMKSMLGIFGAVAFGQQVPVPSSCRVQLAVFEFFSSYDAVQAVDAIGNRSGSSFSLLLINRDGSVARLPQHAAQQPPLEGRMPPHSHSDRMPSPAAPLAGEEVLDMHRASVPLFTGDANHAAFLAAAHMHAHTSPPPVAAPAAVPATVAMASSALSSKWPAAAGMPLVPGMPMQPPARRPTDFLTTFDPSEAASGGVRARTTIMIRNIPCRWTADDLLSVLSHIINGTWDLLYMPCKNTAVANAGYAFMNFCTSQDTLRLYNAMHGQQWPHTRSGKICEIRYARIQGRQLLTHLNSSDPSGAAAFRGYLAYPSGGMIVVHGPNNAQPALPMHPHHAPLQGTQHVVGESQHAARTLLPSAAYTAALPPVTPRPPLGMHMMPGMMPTRGGNTAAADLSGQPREFGGYSDIMQDGWPVQPVPYSGAAPPLQPVMQVQPAGMAVPTTRGIDLGGSNAYQLQYMLQSLMQSMPAPPP